MEVRPARTADLPAITAIAVDTWKHAYSDLIGAAAVERYLEASYSPVGLKARLEDHPIYLAADGRTVMAFADVFVEDGCVVISELATVRRWQRHGCATRLVEEAREHGSGLPVTADVFLGNVAGEQFYEHRGFVPGASTAVDFFGETVVERRWWAST